MDAQQEPFPSLKWMWALRDSEIPESLKLLGYVIGLRADVHGLTRPTLPQLMLATPKDLSKDESAPVSKSTIERRRRKLVQMGWLELVAKGNGPGQASAYRLTFPTAQSTSESTSEPLPESTSGETYQERLEAEVITTGRGNHGPVRGSAPVGETREAPETSPLGEQEPTPVTAEEEFSVGAARTLDDLASRGCDFTPAQRGFVAHCFDHDEQGFYRTVGPAFNGSARNPTAVVLHRLRERMGDPAAPKSPQPVCEMSDDDHERGEALKYLKNAYCQRSRPIPAAVYAMSLDELDAAINEIEGIAV